MQGAILVSKGIPSLAVTRFFVCILTIWIVVYGLVGTANAGALFAGQLTISKYQLVKKYKDGATTEYDYQVFLSNRSTQALSQVTASLINPPSNTTLLNGSINFPAVAPGAIVKSENSLKFSSKKPPKLTTLLWGFSGADFTLIEPKVAISKWTRVKQSKLKPSGDIEAVYSATLTNLDSSEIQSITLSLADSRVSFPLGNSLSFVNLAKGTKVNSQDAVTIRYPSTIKFKPTDLLQHFSWNYRPTANAGNDQKLAAGTDSMASLDGSRSTDRDGDLLTFSWALDQKPANSLAAISGNTAVNPTLAPIDLDGDYKLKLVVNDGKANSVADTVVVTTGDLRPQANAGPDQTASVKSTVTLDGSASIGSGLSYKWEIVDKPSGSRIKLLNPTTVAPSFKIDKLGSYLLQLTVSNNIGSSKPDSVEITTGIPKPIAVIDPTQQSVFIGNLVSLDGSNSQAANQATPSYRWSFTAQPSSSQAVFTDITTEIAQFTPDLAGEYIAQLMVNDGIKDSIPATARVSASGSKPVSVPNLIGQTKATAESQIQALGLILGTETFEHNETVADGQVISQNPPADTSTTTGNTVELVISLGPNTGLPPNPDTIAPPVASAVASNTFQTSEFLYSGANPVQTGVAADAIEAERAAVISGKVLNKAGEALSGVTISILDHAELGQTQSRSDGYFDLAVNGGGPLTLTYLKTGYLPGQRLIDVPWQTGITVEDMRLVTQDSKVSIVKLNDNSEAIHVAQGSVVTDNDGSRQATLLIPQGTQAHIFNPNGTTQIVNTLNLRLTEYTAGENGEASMPGPLPASSAYTYAFEMKADEADVKINGKDVVFDSPVPFYIDNFLDFPVGSPVPVG